MLSLNKVVPMALVCLLLIFGLAASAKADTLENLVFTGTATFCAPVFPATCAIPPTGPLVGTYTLDVTTQQIVGPWSFSTPFGVISSTDPGASTFIDPNDVFNELKVRFSESTSTPAFYEFLNFEFPLGDTQELGSLANNPTGYACSDSSTPGHPQCGLDYSVSGSTSVAPEPGALLLLGTGLLGIVAAGRRKLLG